MLAADGKPASVFAVFVLKHPELLEGIPAYGRGRAAFEGAAYAVCRYRDAVSVYLASQHVLAEGECRRARRIGELVLLMLGFSKSWG